MPSPLTPVPRQKKVRFGSLAFFIPIILVAALIVWAVLSSTLTQSGTLDVQAFSSGRYYPTSPLKVNVTINGNAGQTPFNETLLQGPYTVVYSGLPGYHVPIPKTIVVHSGSTTFATGIYDPVLVGVAIGASGYNSSKVTVLHAVTPLVWVNTESQIVTIHGGPLVNAVSIRPGENYTMVIQKPGTYTFGVVTTNYTITVIAA